MSTWIDYTRRNDPAQQYYVDKLERKLMVRSNVPDVLCFWTKAPRFIAENYKDSISRMWDCDSIVLAQVTWNTGYELLEPNVTHAFSDLAALVDLLGSENVRLRFDPIIPGFTKLEMFKVCANHAAELGVRQITTNFLVPSYKGVGALLKEQFNINAAELASGAKIDILNRMVEVADARGVRVAGCAEIYRDGIDKKVDGLLGTGCSDPEWAREHNKSLSFTVRPSRPGCRCVYTNDWGEYSDRGGPKCPHQCVYCYAK
jgi:DNA repair photolyase